MAQDNDTYMDDREDELEEGDLGYSEDDQDRDINNP